jgi:6-phosphogluconolactonase (cycloisomerase 2 family)
MYEAYGPRHLEFKQNIYIATVVLDVENAFDTTWHLGLLYKLSELQISLSTQAYYLFSFSEKIQSFSRK